MRAEDAPAALADEADGYGVRSAHGEPLVLGGEVVGALFVEPAAAASPRCCAPPPPRLPLRRPEAWPASPANRRRLQPGGRPSPTKPPAPAAPPDKGRA